MSVAQQVALHLPEQALLRRHEDPIERRLVSLPSSFYTSVLMNALFV